MQSRGGLLLIAHGTRDPDGIAELLNLLRRMRQALPECSVEAGVLEFPNERLTAVEDAVERCLLTNSAGLAALPLLLHQAGHSKRDAPTQLLAALEPYPGLRLSTCPSLGIQSSLLDVLVERAQDAQRSLSQLDPRETALLLVGRGSTDPQANDEFFEVPRLLKECTAYRWIEGCFVSLAHPYVPEGIERCLELGARKVVVVPYFLSTGILVKRIGCDVATAQTAHPQQEFVVGSHIGLHPKLIQLLMERARVLLSQLALETEVRKAERHKGNLVGSPLASGWPSWLGPA